MCVFSPFSFFSNGIWVFYFLCVIIENNNIQNADDDDVENNNVQNEENDVENNIHVNIESEFGIIISLLIFLNLFFLINVINMLVFSYVQIQK